MAEPNEAEHQDDDLQEMVAELTSMLAGNCQQLAALRVQVRRQHTIIGQLQEELVAKSSPEGVVDEPSP